MDEENPEYVDESVVIEETVRLKEGLVLKDLLETFSSEICLDARDNNENELESERRVDTCYDFNQFKPYINLDCVLTGEDSAQDSFVKSPFEIIKEKMTNIISDGKVMKRVKKEGEGSVVPKNSVIYIHYSSYFEMEEIPFDTSYLRNNKPLRFQLGRGNMYEGFEIAVSTMKKGEVSQFLVDPSCAFGKMGVPPRIPPSATILLEIEMISFVDCGDAVPVANEAEKKDFSSMYKSAQSFHVLANDYFVNRNIPAAVDNYRKAERVLTNCRMSNDEEERKQKKLLMKIYVNLCICYNDPRMKMPQKVCICARDATFVSPKEADNNAKLQFQWGKALMSLNEFKRASQHLKQALKIEPHNRDVSKQLEELEKRKRKCYQEEKIRFQKGFQFQKIKNTEDSQKEPSVFMKNLEQELKRFKESPVSRLYLSSGLTSEEKRAARTVAEEMGFSYQEKIVDDSVTISILKIIPD